MPQRFLLATPRVDVMRKNVRQMKQGRERGGRGGRWYRVRWETTISLGLNRIDDIFLLHRFQQMQKLPTFSICMYIIEPKYISSVVFIKKKCMCTESIRI